MKLSPHQQLKKAETYELSANENEQSLISHSMSYDFDSRPYSPSLPPSHSVSIPRKRRPKKMMPIVVEEEGIVVNNRVFGDEFVEFKNVNQLTTRIMNCKLPPNTLVFEMAPVLDPNSFAMIGWNVFITLLLLFYFYEIPIYIAWGNRFWTNFTFISYLLLTIDMVLEFFTSYYQHGNLVTKKSKIATNYLRGNFVYDVIAVVSFAVRVNLATDNYRYLYFLFYFKLPALMKTFNEFDEMVLLYRRLRTGFQIAKILLAMFFAFFTFGCFFFVVGRWCTKNGHKSWLQNDGNFGPIGEKDVHEQFFFSLYFSMGTMSSTMGYGDITPLNIYECSYCLCGIIFAVMIFAININSIFKILEEHNSTSLRIFRTRVAINRFMRNKQVPRELSERVRQYLNEHWYEEGNRNHELERETINSLAPELREELMLSSYGQFLLTTDLFIKNFSRPFLKALSLQIQEVAYSQGETIFSDRSPLPNEQNQIYYIASGSVMVYPTLPNKDPQTAYLNKLKEGEYFGELSFLTAQPRRASAVAHSYSLVYVITRERFLHTLQRFPQDYEQYCMVRDNVMLNQDFTSLGTSCWTCGSNGHYSNSCPASHYVPSIQKILDLDINCDQERRKVERPIRSHWPTRKNQGQLVKLRKRNQIGLANFLHNEQRKIRNSNKPMENKPMEASQRTPQQLELQMQFAQFKQPAILTGLMDFDRPKSYRRYHYGENIQDMLPLNVG